SGPSLVRFEPPDICFCAYVGDISAAEGRRTRDEQDAALDGLPYGLMLVDLSKTGAVCAEARKIGAERPKVPVYGTAIFGASFAIRVIAQLVTTAGSLLAKVTESPVRFFATENQARAWLNERREVARQRLRE